MFLAGPELADILRLDQALQVPRFQTCQPGISVNIPGWGNLSGSPDPRFWGSLDAFFATTILTPAIDTYLQSDSSLTASLLSHENVLMPRIPFKPSGKRRKPR